MSAGFQLTSASFPVPRLIELFRSPRGPTQGLRVFPYFALKPDPLSSWRLLASTRTLHLGR